MQVILGATGHIGSELTKLLRAVGERVTIVSRSRESAEPLAALGAEVAVRDVAALGAVFRRATRAFVLNPPAPPSSDTVQDERATARSIVSALEGTRLERIVAESTYGAQPGEHLGDRDDGLPRIARPVGSASELSFNRAFRRAIGEPPGAYRDHMRRGRI